MIANKGLSRKLIRDVFDFRLVGYGPFENKLISFALLVGLRSVSHAVRTGLRAIVYIYPSPVMDNAVTANKELSRTS